MISIEVKNAPELIRNKKGWFISRALSMVGLSELAVEKLIAEELKTVLRDQGVEVEIKVFRQSVDS